MRLAAGLAVFGLLGGVPADAAESRVDVAGATTCSFDVYSIDEDPKGLNLRAGPTAGSALVTTLENTRRMSDDDYAVELHVVGSKDGWLLVDKAWFGAYGDADEKDKAGTVFSGKGWVSGKLVATDVNDALLRDGPSTTAKVVSILASPNSSGPGGHSDRFDVARIYACKGEWADVEGEFQPDHSTRRGWATRLCSNQVTACR